jgi:hypothetical protein
MPFMLLLKVVLRLVSSVDGTQVRILKYIVVFLLDINLCDSLLLYQCFF